MAAKRQTSPSSGLVLVVDDETEMRAAVAQELSSRGHAVLEAAIGDAAFEVLLAEDVDVVLTDLRMREKDGLELCRRIAGARSDVPVLVMTGFGSIDAAVATLRAGAFDFLTKPFDPEELLLAVERALAHRALTEELRRLRSRVAEVEASAELLGESQPMQDLRELVCRVAASDATVLVTGESGSGKELVARALHAASPRSSGPLVAVNCAALPEALLESELFGHVRGAFTDAKTSRKGLFVEASGGTLLLDEIGEMPPGMQAKLLRALETRRVRPVGATGEVPFDVRIVTATHRDLEAAVAEKTFRQDLYYRINVVHVEVPPLRVRGNDILLLAQHFLVRCASRQGKALTSLSRSAAELLLAYAWPGNVRELYNCIERAVALARFEQIAVEDLPPKLRAERPRPPTLSEEDPDLLTLEELESRHIRRVMDASGHNKRLAAKILGVDRTTLYRKLEKLGMHRSV